MPSNFKVGDHIYCGCDPMCTTSGEIESIQNDYYKLKGQTVEIHFHFARSLNTMPPMPTGNSSKSFSVGDVVKVTDQGSVLYGDIGVITAHNIVWGADSYTVEFTTGSAAKSYCNFGANCLALISKANVNLRSTTPVAGSLSGIGNFKSLSSMYDDWSWGNGKPGEEPKKKETRCECGTTKAMGENYPPENHSDYCPIYVEAKKKKDGSS